MKLNLGSLFLLIFASISFANPYNFKVTTQKKSVYLGEEFKVKFVFTFKDPSKIAEVNFSPPLFHNLNITKEEENQTDRSQSWIYTLRAYKETNLTIDKAYLDIALKKNSNKTIGNFDEYDYDYITLETSPLNINLINKKIQTKLFGDFNITSTIDKKENIVNLTINITGRGNFEDIGAFKLKLPDATVYDDKPIIQKNSFSQKFAIVSEKSFTVPSFSIKYTHDKLKKIIQKQTKPIFVQVKKVKQVTKSNKSLTKEKSFSFVYFLIGIIFGYILSKFFTKKKKKKDEKLFEKIEKAKDTKEILKLLISHNKNQIYQNIIDELENDIYITKKNSLTKKYIKKKIFT